MPRLPLLFQAFGLSLLSAQTRAPTPDPSLAGRGVGAATIPYPFAFSPAMIPKMNEQINAI